MPLCEYGCGQKATHQFNNGKWCCSTNIAKCPKNRQNNSIKLSGVKKSKLHKQHMSESGKGRIPWNKGKKTGHIPWNKGLTKETDERIKLYGEKQSQTTIGRKGIPSKYKGKTYEEIYGNKKAKKLKEIHQQIMIGNNGNKLTIKKIKNKYHTFAKEEEMRYNPDKKTNKKEIQVHCKNHNCPNSKEQGGWFTPTKDQINERIRQLEQDYGNGGCYFYCCNECKNECPLYNMQSDPFKDKFKNYTQSEYQQFRTFVLERDIYICQYCGKLAEHVHHERPQKLEPFFTLDPDLAWSVCKTCHYEKGHKDECSTGKLANKFC